jgi:hypothetical protein
MRPRASLFRRTTIVVFALRAALFAANKTQQLAKGVASKMTTILWPESHRFNFALEAICFDRLQA